MTKRLIFRVCSSRVQSTPENCWDDYVKQHYLAGIIPNCAPENPRYSVSKCVVPAKHKTLLEAYKKEVRNRWYIFPALPEANHLWGHQNKTEAQKQSRCIRAKQREKKRMMIESKEVIEEEESSIEDSVTQEGEEEWWKEVPETMNRITRSKARCHKQQGEQGCNLEPSPTRKNQKTQPGKEAPLCEDDQSSNQDGWWKQVPETTDRITRSKTKARFRAECREQHAEILRQMNWETYLVSGDNENTCEGEESDASVIEIDVKKDNGSDEQLCEKEYHSQPAPNAKAQEEEESQAESSASDAISDKQTEQQTSSGSSSEDSDTSSEDDSSDDGSLSAKTEKKSNWNTLNGPSTLPLPMHQYPPMTWSHPNMMIAPNLHPCQWYLTTPNPADYFFKEHPENLHRKGSVSKKRSRSNRPKTQRWESFRSRKRGRHCSHGSKKK